MPGFDGTGPRGMGPMTGGGRGSCSPRGVRPAFRAYGFSPRRYGYPYYEEGSTTPAAMPFVPTMNRGQELDMLKSQAQALRGQLEQIETRLQKLGKEA